MFKNVEESVKDLWQAEIGRLSPPEVFNGQSTVNSRRSTVNGILYLEDGLTW
jgi:hypothetical protein